MSRIGDEVQRARRSRGWSREKLAEVASRLPGAPEIDHKTVEYLERTRTTFRFDTSEPLPWLMKALGMKGEVVLQALGLAA